MAKSHANVLPVAIPGFIDALPSDARCILSASGTFLRGIIAQPAGALLFLTWAGGIPITIVYNDPTVGATAPNNRISLLSGTGSHVLNVGDTALFIYDARPISYSGIVSGAWRHIGKIIGP